jgi:hypothetical protein
MDKNVRKFLGIISIACGIILVVIAMVPLLIRLAVFLVGMYGINYGLRLLHYPSLWRSTQILFWRRHF